MNPVIRSCRGASARCDALAAGARSRAASGRVSGAPSAAAGVVVHASLLLPAPHEGSS